MPGHGVARVLLDSPLPQLDRLFDYAIPAELAGEVRPGVRVRAPLRSAGRVVDGYVVEVGEQDAAPPRPLSELDAVVSPVPVLTPSLYTLARRVADRAAGSAGDILRLAIPKRMVRAEKAWSAAPPPQTPIVDEGAVATAGRTLAAFPGLEEALREGHRVAVSAPPVPVRTEAGETLGAWAVVLAAAAATTLAAGRSAILAVPDYRDQEQLEAALAELVPADAVVRDDARQSGPARYANYLRLLADPTRVRTELLQHEK